MILIVVLTVLWLSAPGYVSVANGQGATIDTIGAFQGGNSGQCLSEEERERARSEIHQTATSVVSTTCYGTPGWRRVAFINMTDTSYSCPTGLNLTSFSKRTCGRSLTPSGCSSTTFSVSGLPYSRVCGRIRGYQFGPTNGFGNSDRQGIDGYYVEGISLTHGGAGNRQHIWTFAAGQSEMPIRYPNFGCPCDTASPSVVPAFVGNDYFCESGFSSEWTFGFFGYSHDVLWDGHFCASTSTCCQFNNPPWFTKNLPSATTNDIELRICAKSRPSFEDVLIELIELSVQ